MDETRASEAISSPPRPKASIKMPSLLAFTVVVAALSLTLEACSQNVANSESKVRVLLLNNSDKQHAIEEAASLSLDLPAPDSSVDGRPVPTSSYHQVSLASLTLNQRQSRMATSEATETSNATEASTSTASVMTELVRNQTETTSPQPPTSGSSFWSELYMKRHKPSWLNVSSQFKITGQSIEELEFMMPVEYLLRQAFDSPVLLKTKLGVLEGVRSIKFNKHLYTFLSVPYAKPPVDDLRFKAPQPIGQWDGILQATKWPPFCVQPSMTLASKSSPVHVLSQMMSEDCLYLNIWTPSLKFKKNHRRPVMVWIHGGAFQYGGISVDENDGSALSLLGDVVVVTLNYRISAFGFLNANNPTNAPNNVGLLDQQRALQWVHENIKQFGGDPQQVTLFGESAGGHSVGLHTISPKSHPYFQRAILQSGVPISFLRSYDVNSDNKGAAIAEGVSSVMMARRLKCLIDAVDSTSSSDAPTMDTTMGTKVHDEDSAANSTEASDDPASNEGDLPLLSDQVIDCMRRKTSLEILKALGAPGNAGFFPTGNDLEGFFPHGNVKDSFDSENLKVGPQKDYLIGTNTDEGTFMLHYGLPSLFPSKSVPKVSTLQSLKSALTAEIERMSKLGSPSANKSEVLSASGGGSQNGGAQAHLYGPLLRTSTSVLEGFMPKSRVRTLDNGTLVGNMSSNWTIESEFGQHVGSLITDIIFLCPARSLARVLSEANRNVYFYIYGYRSSMSQYHEWIGVTHHDEVEFVFGRPIRLADVYSGKDIEMSQRMIKTWSHFARTGQMLGQCGVEWPKYGEEDNNYMNLLADTASIGQRYHDKVCNIYDTVISVHLQDA